MGMKTYWHIADPSYQDGEDLLSYDEQEARGYELPAYKWDDYLDTDVVCLFSSREDAETFRTDFLPGGLLLQVDLPEDVHTLTVGEGYAAVARVIPAEFVSLIE